MADIEGLADAAMAGSLSTDQKLVYSELPAALKNAYYYDFELDDYRRGSPTELGRAAQLQRQR